MIKESYLQASSGKFIAIYHLFYFSEILYQLCDTAFSSARERYFLNGAANSTQCICEIKARNWTKHRLTVTAVLQAFTDSRKRGCAHMPFAHPD
jgi:hypothetical protein